MKGVTPSIGPFHHQDSAQNRRQPSLYLCTTDTPLLCSGFYASGWAAVNRPLAAFGLALATLAVAAASAFATRVLTRRLRWPTPHRSP